MTNNRVIDCMNGEVELRKHTIDRWNFGFADDDEKTNMLKSSFTRKQRTMTKTNHYEWSSLPRIYSLTFPKRRDMSKSFKSINQNSTSAELAPVFSEIGYNSLTLTRVYITHQ